jgi:hypothetical protein
MPDSAPAFSITLVLPYFGSFPNYFPLFVASCASNPTVNWIILSSSRPPCELPGNVRWQPFSITEMKRRINDVLQISSDIRRPYKVCDFRPAFGLLFRDELSSSDFWGHCDADVIFGDLRKFMTPAILSQHVKVQMRGAFSLYRNSEAGNTLFTLPHEDVDYREVFRDHRNWGFDEWQGVYRIIRDHSIPFYQGNIVAEIKPAHYDLRLADHKNFFPQVFLWKDGRLLRRHWTGGVMQDDEFAYIHLQKRRYIHVDVKDPSAGFYILPDSFVEATEVNGGPDWAAKANCRRRSYEWAFQAGRIPAFLRRVRNTKRFAGNRIRRASAPE